MTHYYYHGKRTSWQHWYRKPSNVLKLVQWTLWAVVIKSVALALIGTHYGWFEPVIVPIAGIGTVLFLVGELRYWRRQIKYKENILHQIASRSNERAIDGVRIASEKGWLRDGSMKGANLWRANLQGADFLHASLQDANFSEADLTRAFLGGADLKGAIFCQACLHYANFIGTELEAVDFMEANLQAAKLLGAKVVGASFAEANLEGADFQQAVVHQVDFRRARLAGANFKDAKLQELDLTDATYNETTIWPDDFTPGIGAGGRED